MDFSDWGSRLFDIAGIHKLGTKKWFNSHSVTDGLEIVNFGCDSLFLICLGEPSGVHTVGGHIIVSSAQSQGCERLSQGDAGQLHLT